MYDGDVKDAFVKYQEVKEAEKAKKEAEKKKKEEEKAKKEAEKK